MLLDITLFINSIRKYLHIKTHSRVLNVFTEMLYLTIYQKKTKNILHAVWYLPFTNIPRKYTVTYHFSDLQNIYSGKRQIHTKCQLQYVHPPQISTSGNCHCVINKSYWIHRVNVKVYAQVTTVTSYAPITAFVTFTLYKFHGAPQTLTWQSPDLVQCHLQCWYMWMRSANCLTMCLTRYVCV